jgi:hypothetical protein
LYATRKIQFVDRLEKQKAEAFSEISSEFSADDTVSKAFQRDLCEYDRLQNQLNAIGEVLDSADPLGLELRDLTAVKNTKLAKQRCARNSIVSRWQNLINEESERHRTLLEQLSADLSGATFSDLKAESAAKLEEMEQKATQLSDLLQSLEFCTFHFSSDGEWDNNEEVACLREIFAQLRIQLQNQRQGAAQRMEADIAEWQAVFEQAVQYSKAILQKELNDQDRLTLEFRQKVVELDTEICIKLEKMLSAYAVQLKKRKKRRECSILDGKVELQELCLQPNSE